jgi:hypothetical protein
LHYVADPWAETVAGSDLDQARHVLGAKKQHCINIQSSARLSYQADRNTTQNDSPATERLQ